ncbi:hypothetical protein [Clostridium sp. OS1-26]|uniref:hypothetical protein n=1 Tax=Clostridium sp. OS1-26 TaxID=3070681 RepID=UPI0027E1167C|nr:hypothetical protein [Clostridium sp. OS1-26]WML34381.1 hypothetical protein RCG18_24355 [Clostridium sp. OS1-26]
MSFDIVRGKVSKPEQTKQLIDQITKYMSEQDDDGTLYLGYPLTANRDTAVTIDALLVTVNKGMIAFIFGNSTDSKIELYEQQDALYFHMDFYLRNYSSLRKGRNLAFTPTVITILPMPIDIDSDEYCIVTNDEIVNSINGLDGFNKSLYRKLCEILQKVSEIKPRKKRNNVKLENSYGGVIKSIEKEIANLDQWQKKLPLKYLMDHKE